MIRDCEVCGEQRECGEAFTIPGDLNKLVPLLTLRAGDDWPGVWCCADCAPIASTVLSSFYELPLEELAAVTSGIVAAACRAVRAGADGAPQIQEISL
jgi:hypothetical protein